MFLDDESIKYMPVNIETILGYKKLIKQLYIKIEDYEFEIKRIEQKLNEKYYESFTSFGIFISPNNSEYFFNL